MRPEQPPAQEEKPSMNGWLKLAASILIAGHLWAIVGHPLEFATQGPGGTSPAARAFYSPVRPYSEFAYLNHGYAFFAPDPGPSHLIRVRYRGDSSKSDSVNEERRDQNETVELFYPDLKRQWPRLLYHRHFMLAEFLHNTYCPPRMPDLVAENPSLAMRWRNDRARYEAILQSMENHLVEITGSSDLEIRRIEHQLIGLPEFLDGQTRLDDPTLYQELVEELEPEPMVPRFGVPIGGRRETGRNQ